MTMATASSSASSMNKTESSDPPRSSYPEGDDDSDSSVLYEDVDCDLSGTSNRDDDDSDSDSETSCSYDQDFSRLTEARDSMAINQKFMKPKCISDKRSTNLPPKTLNDSHTTFTASTANMSSDEMFSDNSNNTNLADGGGGSSSVQFDQVREREFRMTLGSHPDAESVPVQLSWSILGKSKRYPIDEYESHKHVRNPQGLQKVPERTRNRIALRNNTTQAILSTLESMKLIRRRRQESMHDPQVRGISFFRSKNKNHSAKKSDGQSSSSSSSSSREEQHATNHERSSLDVPLSTRKRVTNTPAGKGRGRSISPPVNPLPVQNDSRWK